MLVLLLSCFAATPSPDHEGETPSGFQPLEAGLDLAVFDSPVKSGVSDEKIHVLRADPKLWTIDVGLASEGDGAKRTAPKWLADNPTWVAVINASMFQMDHKSSVFQLKHRDHFNQATWHDNASNVLVFDAAEGGPSALLDVNCSDWPGAQKTYASWVQSYRLLDCAQKPTWGDKGGRKWSHALIGADMSGNLLFIHARSPFTTRQMTEILLSLPLDLKTLMYAEGGPEASLVVRTGTTDLQRVGSFETGFYEKDTNHEFWALPNVVALERL